jgi:hypothetical protein
LILPALISFLVCGLFNDGVDGNETNNIKNPKNTKGSKITNCRVAYSPIEYSNPLDLLPYDDYETTVKRFFKVRIDLVYKYYGIEYCHTKPTILPLEKNNYNGTFSQNILLLGEKDAVYNCEVRFTTQKILLAQHPPELVDRHDNFNNLAGAVARGYMFTNEFFHAAHSIPIKFVSYVHDPEPKKMIKWYDLQFKPNENGQIISKILAIDNPFQIRPFLFLKS